VIVTLHDNVFSSLNFSFAACAVGGEVGKESLPIFSNRGMAGGHVSKMGT